MACQTRFALTIAALLLTGVSGGTDRVEIIIDNSAAMWDAVGGNEPRVIALREALGSFAVSTSMLNDDLEIGLRTMGGRHELIDDGACDNTELIVPFGPVEPTQWREALGDLFPRGRRPLARAVTAALDDLADTGGRIVIITAGGDECHTDFATMLAELTKEDATVDIRIVGLSMDRKTVLAMTTAIPIRNLSDATALLDTLFWAARSSETPPSKTMDFEVLATLESPAEVSAGEEVEVTWTGPDGPQDYLSIAEPGAENEAYLEWALTDEGNPLRLRAPRRTGDFELRYVRAEDGEVLARRQVTVVAEAVSLEAPPEVEVGSRFVVEWSGTPGGGDFIAIAKEDSAAGEHFDWSYTTAGRRLTLAAPFHPGRYEVRYVSGSEVEILARKPLMVR